MPDQRFQWILETAPEWWQSFPGVNVHVTSSTAVLPEGIVVEPGDFIVRADDGTLSVEVCEQGRIQARAFLAELLEAVTRTAKATNGGADA